MTALNLQGCEAVLADLLGARARHFAHLGSGAVQRARLQGLHADVLLALEWEARPRPESIRTLVSRHTQATAALATVLSGHQQDPLNSEAQRTAARRLEASVVAACRGAHHSAIARAEFAHRARNRRPALEAALDLLPARVGELLDYWIEQGDAIQHALSAKTTGPGSPAPTPQVLVRAVGHALALLRRAVHLELALYPALPRDLEALLLGYADALATKPRRKRPTPDDGVAAVEVEPATADVEAATVDRPAPGQATPTLPAPPPLFSRPRLHLAWPPSLLGRLRGSLGGVLLTDDVRQPPASLGSSAAPPGGRRSPGLWMVRTRGNGAATAHEASCVFGCRPNEKGRHTVRRTAL